MVGEIVNDDTLMKFWTVVSDILCVVNRIYDCQHKQHKFSDDDIMNLNIACIRLEDARRNLLKITFGRPVPKCDPKIIQAFTEKVKDEIDAKRMIRRNDDEEDDEE